MTDNNELKKNLSRRGYRCALKEGKPILTRSFQEPGLQFISADRMVEELAKIGKYIDSKTCTIVEGAPSKPVDKPADKPAPAKPVPATTTKPGDTWTKEELEKLSYNDLRKLAKLWDDVHGNQGKDHIVSTMTGKPKNP